jgi:hypothetical protein
MAGYLNAEALQHAAALYAVVTYGMPSVSTPVRILTWADVYTELYSSTAL